MILTLLLFVKAKAIMIGEEYIFTWIFQKLKSKKGNNMLDAIFSAIKSEINGLSHMSDIMKSISDLLEHFEEDYVKDGNARNAAIDAVIQILQNHKSK